MAISINREALKLKLLKEKQQALNFRERKHRDWDDNYRLYRLQTDLDRLVQRQEACVPLLKGSIKTYMSRIGDRPEVTIEDKSGDLDKEIVVNQKINDIFDENKVELLDKIDKKQVLLYASSWKKFNWRDKKITIEIKDAYDMLHDPKMLSHDVETARYIIEGGIYRSVEEILADDKYDKEGKDELRAWRMEINGNESTGEKGQQPQTTAGINLTNKNLEDIKARNERLETMGVESVEDVIAGGDVICHINNHITEIWDSSAKKYVRHVCVYADDRILLSVKTLKEVTGVDFYPYERWCGDDMEVTDSYPDSIADILRVPNQMINTWYSQYFENRTLRNFGMNFYDATIEGFEPDALDPRPGGWYPLPGKPAEVYQRIDIPELAGITNDIQFLISIAEKETASTDVEKGAISDAQKTLGEIKIAVAKANERINEMSPYYNNSWKASVEKILKMIQANMGKMKEELFKKAPDGKYVAKEVSVEDYKSEKGFKVTVDTKAQKDQNQIAGLNALLAIKNEFPNNSKLRMAIQKRSLKLVDLSPEEIESILDEEEKNAELAKIQPPQQEQPAQVMPDLGAMLGGAQPQMM